jgi:hypothetical protein
MNTRNFRLIFTIFCLLALSLTAAAQQKKKPDSISTATKLVITKLKVGEGDAFEVRGKATFVVTAANSDDSVAGTLTYTVPDDARQKVAQLTGKPLDQIPSSVTAKDVVATFQKATACPVVHLEFSPMDVEIAGVKNHFNRFVLDINETKEELAQLFCIWTRQINTGRARRGVIARMNIILNGEEDRTDTSGDGKPEPK